ncbi:MAG: hypothetical protein NTV43_04525 [Methylococcales bacterium]|nr:hypothetical protein [Methylococcales bacterium]
MPWPIPPDSKGIYTGSKDGRLRLWDRKTSQLRWATPTPFWNIDAWTFNTLFIWLALVFVSLFIPCLKCFDPGRVWFIRKPNHYIQFYQIPGINRWLPPQD